MNILNVFIILILISFLSYVIGKSSIRKNVRYISLILLFLFFHALGLLVSEIKNYVPIVYIIGGAIGILLTYYIWFIKKSRKSMIDYLKIIWLIIFILSYLHTYLQYNSYSSEKGPHVLAGLKNSICHGEIIKWQFVNTALISFIAILVYKETNFKQVETNRQQE